jgi:excisionase family DNA binding protein
VLNTKKQPISDKNTTTLRQVASVANFEQLLDSEEAAALLGIHKKTLQRMARNGQVPGFQIGDLWRFRASSLNEWLGSKLAS